MTQQQFMASLVAIVRVRYPGMPVAKAESVLAPCVLELLRDEWRTAQNATLIRQTDAAA